MATPPTVVPNHHADFRGFSGVFGFVAGLTMIIGRGAVARLAADLSGVTATDHVVDVGCGPGAAAREAARRGARVTGVDPAPVMLKLARWLTRRGVSVTWTDGAAESLPVPDASATVLWSIATVHHWPDLAAGLAEARRVLVPDGRLLAIERQVRAGAKGLGSHGWTVEQANAFADSCRAAGFTEARVEPPRAGRRPMVVVRATKPSTT